MKFLKKYYAFLTGLFVFIIYLTTLAPSVVEIDSGELAAVQATLGIAHPTGYPLFTLIGHLFYMIPLPFSKIYQLNLLTAIWCSAAAGVFVYTVKYVLDNLAAFSTNRESKKQTAKKDKSAKLHDSKNSYYEIPEIKKYLSAVAAGLILAFGKTFWFQSTSVEVYSLQLFLLTLIILFLLKAYLSSQSDDKPSFKSRWMLFAFFLALGFSNHMTTLFIIPGAAYLYFSRFGFNKKSIIRILMMLAVFIPLLVLLYSYLPIRASQNPTLNWGNPSDLTRLIRHIAGDQYHVWLFSSTAAAEKQLSYFISNLPNEFSVVLFIFAVGVFVSFYKARKFFYFTAVTFLFTVLYAINYNIHDIDSYFLLAYIMLAFFAAFGTVQLLSFLKTNKYPYSVPAGLIIIFIAVEFFSNYSQVNQSDVYTFEDYTKAVFNYSSKNSVIFSYEWDYFVSPSYYFQYVEKYRPDVTVVDKELLRRSWYYRQLSTDHPGLLSGIKDDVSAFEKALVPFESGENYNASLLESLYRKIMTGLVSSNISKSDFYIAPELFDSEMQKGEFTLPKGYTLVPEIFMFKVVKGKNYVPAPDPDFKIRLPEKRNSYIILIEKLAGSMLLRRALYEMQFDKLDRAKLYIKKVKTDFPDYTIPPGIAQVLEK